MSIAVHMELCSGFQPSRLLYGGVPGSQVSTLLLGRIAPLGWKTVPRMLSGCLETVPTEHPLMRTSNIAQRMTFRE